MNNTQCVLENVRLSYAHLVKPFASHPDQPAKYSCTILLPKTDVAGKAKLDAAIEAAKARGAESQWGGIVPPVCPTPVHDGDGVKQDGTEFGPECKGHWVMTAGAKADYPIEIVDRHLNKILDPTQIYSGMYANVCVNMYPYLYNGKKGIGCGLGPVQKTADGEAFGGGAPTAASVFTSMAANTQRINPLTGKPM